MPATINGIGTSYFLKRNRRQFDGVCQYCGRPSRMENYETWLVFSVFFVPVAPLGKKQVLNYCPLCTRHNVLGYAAWQKAQQEAVAKAADELRQHSHDPDAAIGMHATYDAYQLNDDAERFADAMMTLYGDVARVQFYLAAWYERLGRKAQANAAFAAAYQLEPANLVFRRAVAIGQIEEGRPDEAAQLLEPFKPPAKTFEPPLFIMLGKAYAAQGRHQEALEQFKLVAAAAPAVLKDRAFRKAVRQSERAAGSFEPLVGREPFYRSRPLQVVAAASLLLALLLGANWYIRHHRRLYVVNGLSLPISVKVDEGAVVNVPPQNHVMLRVAEGKHTAALVEPKAVNPPMEFDVASSWWAGLFRSPAFVIDPAGSAAVFYQEVSYSAPGENPPPGQQQLRVGEPISTFASVDYAFQEFPATVQVKRNQPVRKSRVSQLSFPPAQLVTLTAAMPGMADKAITLAETHLRAAPDDGLLLWVYWGQCSRQRQFERCAQFLSGRLADRPLRIEWHRAWQSTGREQNKDKELVRQYDELLAGEPGNSALLYLRGRLEQGADAALGYYERAIGADANNAYPRYAQAIAWQGRGEFERARATAAEAVRLKPGDLQMKHVFDLLRFATGEFAALEQELRSAQAAQPLSQQTAQQLVRVLAAQGKHEEARRQIEEFGRQATAQQPQQAPAWTRELQQELLYSEGNFDELVKVAASAPNEPAALAARYQAEFELGRAVDPPPGVTVLDEGQDAYALLCQAIALYERGDKAAAEKRRHEAVEMLRHGKRDERDAAAVLAKSGMPDQDDLDDLSFDPRLRAIALVAIADALDPPDPKLLNLAEKVNCDRRFPYHFLQRTISAMRSRTVAARAAVQ